MNPVANMRPNTNGPNAAIAAVQPITPPACRGWKIIGICLKVDALPTPVKKKIASMPQKNFGKSSAESGCNWNDVNAIEQAMPKVAPSVTRPPPTRSAIGPDSTRAAEPTSAPQKA